MTEDQLKEIVEQYIIGMKETDAADCLHEVEAFYSNIDEDPDELLKRAYALYNKAEVVIYWGD
jgi:hypothetical protein